MNSQPLVLSLFPGIGLLDMAFEEEGFCIVRGPDVLWGGDVRRFHPPAGVFAGVIGGPPCQVHSRLRYLNPRAGEKHGDLIPEFCRVTGEAAPQWWLMENVAEAPLPVVAGYLVRSLMLNNRWVGAEQHRLRRFSFGTCDGRTLDVSADVAIFEAPLVALAVTASHREAVPVKLGGSGKVKSTWRPPTVLSGHASASPDYIRQRGSRPISEACVLQGLPADFLEEAPFTDQGKRRVIGNGVPLPMGRAIARAVKRAVEQTAAAS